MVTRLSNAAILWALAITWGCGDGLAEGRFAGFKSGAGDTDPAVTTPGGTTGDAGNNNNLPVINSLSGCQALGSAIGVGSGVSANASPYDMALNSAGKPGIAWGAGGVHVSTWDGNRWNSLGRSLGNNASPPTLAFSADVPYVGWVELSGSTATPMVQSWNGSAWGAVGSLAAYTPTVATPVLAMAVQGSAPAVAYLVPGTGNAASSLQLVRYSGGAWAPSASGNVLTANATSAVLTIDNTARAVLGWSGSPANVGVAPGTSLQGLSTFPLPPSDSASNVVEPVSVALRSDGTVVIAFVDSRVVSGTTSAIVVKAWMNSYWSTLVDAGNGNNTAGGGAVNSASGPAHHLSLAVDNLDALWLAWEDATTQQIYMRTWNGTNWLESGASAHDKGVSNASAPATWPKIRMNGTQPVLSWLEGGTQLRVCGWIPPATTATANP